MSHHKKKTLTPPLFTSRFGRLHAMDAAQESNKAAKAGTDGLFQLAVTMQFEDTSEATKAVTEKMRTIAMTANDVCTALMVVVGNVVREAAFNNSYGNYTFQVLMRKFRAEGKDPLKQQVEQPQQQPPPPQQPATGEAAGSGGAPHPPPPPGAAAVANAPTPATTTGNKQPKGSAKSKESAATKVCFCGRRKIEIGMEKI